MKATVGENKRRALVNSRLRQKSHCVAFVHQANGRYLHATLRLCKPVRVAGVPVMAGYKVTGFVIAAIELQMSHDAGRIRAGGCLRAALA